MDEPGRTTSWVRAGVGLTTTRVLGQGIEFIAFVLLARQLGAEAFGSFWIAFLVARYLSVIGDWGATLRGPRDVAASVRPELIVALARRRTYVSGGLALAYVLVLLAIGHPGLAPLAACTVSRGMNRDWMRLGSAQGLAAGLPSVLQGGVLAALAVLAGTSGQASLATAAAYLVGLAVSISLNPLPPAAQHGARPADDGWLLTASLADQVSLTADSFLLGSLVSLSAAGVYGAIYRLPNAGGTVLGLIVVVMTARLGANRDQVTDGGRADLKRSLALSAAAAALLAAAAPVAGALVVPIFGEEYRSGQTAAAVLVLSLAVVCAGAPLHSATLAARDDRRYALGLVAAALVNIIANLVLIPRYGLTGAAASTLISASALAGYLAIITQQRLDRHGRSDVSG